MKFKFFLNTQYIKKQKHFCMVVAPVVKKIFIHITLLSTKKCSENFESDWFAYEFKKNFFFKSKSFYWFK